MIKSILVVDDNEMIVDLIKDLLSTEYEVDACSDPRDVINLMRRKHYDLVITDFNMPHVDGAKLTREIQKHFSANVFIITGTEDLKIITNNCTPNKIIQKPINWMNMFKDIKQL
jgi:DNA-binding response OmpR family regulator